MGRTRREREREEPPREVELKLAGAPEAIEGLAAHPLLASATQAEGSGALHAVYFDTAENALRKAGLSVRVRRRGDAFLQTIKAERHGRGLVLDRDEWECPVAGEALDFTAAKGTALAPLLENGAARDAIQPAFAVRTERRAHAVARDGALVEIVLDVAEIEAGSRRLRFGEVELELKGGEPSALFSLARGLVEAAPLNLTIETKAERGYALRDGGPAAVKATKIALVPGLSTAEAFRQVARSCLAQALKNEAILRATQAPAALHQMRVGLRRLRAATSLFKPLLADAESERLRGALRALSQELGEVRDLDVLAERLRNASEAEKGGDHATQIAETDGRRERAYDSLMARLDTPAFRLTMFDAAAWIEAGGWLSYDDLKVRKTREEPIELLATAELDRRWHRVLKRARRLTELEPEARHQVRIEIKKLRYGTEFFEGLFPGKRARTRRRAALETLERLQEHLGELNDIAVGGLVVDGNGSGAREEELLAQIRKDHRRLSRLEPFWE